MGFVYIIMFLFIVFVFGIIVKIYGFNIFKFIVFIKEEILFVLGMFFLEFVLLKMMDKMEKYGCLKFVVGFVILIGYLFNLDGIVIYLLMVVIFIV